MPFAGTSVETVRRELESLEGGFVILRRLTYGQKLQRKNMTKLAIDMNSKSKDLKGELEMASREATLQDFKNCIVDHNLFKDAEETVKVNFANQMDVEFLDPRIGEEIEKYIDEINNFEETEEAKN